MSAVIQIILRSSVHVIKPVIGAKSRHFPILHSYICVVPNSSPSLCFSQNPRILELEESLEII